jgi:GNAT superfamily N-acetyltransferase
VADQTASAEIVRGLQERAARALPAEFVEVTGGWWLRRAPGCSWWVESVLPHGEAEPDELPRRVAEAEKFYAAHGSVARFQITSRVCPDGLDAFLAGRGYGEDGPVSLQVATTAHVVNSLATDSLRVDVEERPSQVWFDTWHAVHGGDPRSEWNLLERVENPSGYARVTIGDEIVAVGRVVADGGWAGIFGMATLPPARGKGAGRCVLAALATWVKDHRADRMYLQVERSNVPALRLYEQSGFKQVSDYHYRTAR